MCIRDSLYDYDQDAYGKTITIQFCAFKRAEQKFSGLEELKTQLKKDIPVSYTHLPQKKKGAVGVRGIRLQKKDELEEVYLFTEGTETKVKVGEREVTLNRLKQAKRDGVGTKSR